MINHGSRGGLMAEGSRGGLMAEIGFLTALDAVTRAGPWYLA